MTDAIDFVVGRTDLRRTAFVPGRQSPATPLEAGQVLVRVDRFALTANNITYGAVGDLVGYWSFFPADEGWGRIPVWGFADVAGSRHDALQPGERLYGYFPISTHLILQADRVTPGAFVDASPHRAALPPVYNNYTRVAADPVYERGREAELALFRPLFTTSFLLDDFFADQDFFGARTVVLSSASSKTALGLAFLLASGRRGRVRVVGLTSAAHAAFVARTGWYDAVHTYDDIAALAQDVPTVFVDFAGNGALVGAVHLRLGDRLAYSCRVGVTHWDKMTAPDALPGPAPILFFAPDHVRKRIADWGAAALQARVGEAMRRFLDAITPWFRVVEGKGREAVISVYQATLDGKASPEQGHILSL